MEPLKHTYGLSVTDSKLQNSKHLCQLN